MAVQPAEKIGPSAFDQLDPPDTELSLDCVHCGFCLPTCPTYLVLGNEMDSPRGRIWLIRSAAEGKVGISDNFVKHMRDRKSTRLNSSHIQKSRMPSSA